VDLRVAQVDLQRGRFKLADAKTEAGGREVEITLYLRDELLAHVMDRRARGLPLELSDHFFGTATGNRRDRIASAIGFSPALSSARTQIEPRADCHPYPRSRRTRCGALGPRSRR
jgi:hypothetical protein